jgi:hypothetical protein
METNDKYQDLGFFGGVALAGTAFKYMAPRKEGALKVSLILVWFLGVLGQKRFFKKIT